MLVKLSLTMSSLLTALQSLKARATSGSAVYLQCSRECDNGNHIDNGAFDHDEADITIISYVLAAACDFCVCPVSILGVQSKAGMQGPDEALGWGTVLDINATCSELGPQCLQLLGMHTLSGCDTTSYPYSNGRARALNTLLSGNFPGLADIVGEVSATQVELMEAVKPFFTALYNGHQWNLPALTCLQRRRKHLGT